MPSAASGKTDFFIIDDDEATASLYQALLEDAGYTVDVSTSSVQGLARIKTVQPHYVILDVMMPEMDGLELLKRLRDTVHLAALKVIMVSAKIYDYDERRAFDLGADGYIKKPIKVETFVKEVEAIIQQDLKLTFWGVRGTLPVPGETSLRYGGNTSCVSINFPRDRLFIFDAGTGIKSLSNHLMASGPKKLGAKIFISHPHWDHINALPFFVPFYLQGNEFEICGPSQSGTSMRELISAQMDDVYFPITIKEFSSRVYFQDLSEGQYEIDGIEVTTMLLKHPGTCLGYRVSYQGRIICYITDNELFPEGHEFHDAAYLDKLSAFIAGADVLITDCTYFDDEYPRHVGWGHSSIGEVARMAHHASVKTLYLFHHDPDHSDEDIDRKLEEVENLLRDMKSTTSVVAPYEGLELIL